MISASSPKFVCNRNKSQSVQRFYPRLKILIFLKCEEDVWVFLCVKFVHKARISKLSIKRMQSKRSAEQRNQCLPHKKNMPPAPSELSFPHHLEKKRNSYFPRNFFLFSSSNRECPPKMQMRAPSQP